MKSVEKKVVVGKNVSKKFCPTLKRSMLYGLHDVARNMVGFRTNSEKLREGEFWALDDVSFEVAAGESFGIIGQNGSGKSTLLKLLNGIMMPDRGHITIRGRTAALIELGAGFHPMLSGRENIYINGAILGMTHREIEDKFDEIVNFADIGDFLDAPVKFYSSGMFARLGFAVAVHVNPDVLLVDEVLAVGDADFRSKSYECMLTFKEQGSTVFLVSHDMMSIQAVCDRALWLDQGKVVMLGTPDDVIPRYYKHQDQRGLTRGTRRLSLEGETQELTVTSVETLDANGQTVEQFQYGQPFTVRLNFKTAGIVNEPYIIVAIRSPDSGNLFGLNMATDGGYPSQLRGQGWLDIRFETLPLYPGLYSVGVQIRKNPGVNYFSTRVMAHFMVVSDAAEYGHEGRFREAYIHGGGVAPVVVPYSTDWKMLTGECVFDGQNNVDMEDLGLY